MSLTSSQTFRLGSPSWILLGGLVGSATARGFESMRPRFVVVGPRFTGSGTDLSSEQSFGTFGRGFPIAMPLEGPELFERNGFGMAIHESDLVAVIRESYSSGMRT